MIIRIEDEHTHELALRKIRRLGPTRLTQYLLQFDRSFDDWYASARMLSVALADHGLMLEKVGQGVFRVYMPGSSSETPQWIRLRGGTDAPDADSGPDAATSA